MVDPHNITNYERSDAELQEFWLFCIAVAGKTAVIIAQMLDNFLADNQTPFQYIEHLVKCHQLEDKLREARLGRYGVLTKAYTQSLSLDLRTCSVEDLEAIHGVGHKTARFFILHSRKNAKVAVIDTHMKKYLETQGVVIKNLNKQYYDLEKFILRKAEESGKTFAEFDLDIWRSYARK